MKVTAGGGFVTVNGVKFKGNSVVADGNGNVFIDGVRMNDVTEQGGDLRDVLKTIKRLKKETNHFNWDGERSEPIHNDLWVMAEMMCRRLGAFKKPFVSACGDGHVHLQWSPQEIIRIGRKKFFYCFDSEDETETDSINETCQAAVTHLKKKALPAEKDVVLQNGIVEKEVSDSEDIVEQSEPSAPVKKLDGWHIHEFVHGVLLLILGLSLLSWAIQALIAGLR